MKNVPTRITAACRMKFKLQWADREEGTLIFQNKKGLSRILKKNRP